MKPVPHKGHTNIRLYKCDMKPVPHKDPQILGSITVT